MESEVRYPQQVHEQKHVLMRCIYYNWWKKVEKVWESFISSLRLL
jgi:hypothetical protein